MVHSFQYRKLSASQKIIINVLFVSHVLLKSKDRLTALASAVKIDESSGIRYILLWLPDITAQPTFESSFDPSV